MWNLRLVDRRMSSNSKEVCEHQVSLLTGVPSLETAFIA